MYEVKAINRDVTLYYEQQLDILFEQMFVGIDYENEDDDTYINKKELMKEIYHEVASTPNKKNHSGVPELNDILNAVYEHNMVLQYEIVELDMSYGAGSDRSYYYPESYRNMNKKEIFDALAEAWEEDISNATEYCRATDELVIKLLTELKYSFRVNKGTELNEYFTEEWPEGCDVFVNDCQTLLFPEWHIESLQEYDHSMADEGMIKVLIVSRW